MQFHTNPSRISIGYYSQLIIVIIIIIIIIIIENEKKRKYNCRVTDIEQGTTFTPLVFTTTGGMADECLRYHSRLAELLPAKKQESYATTISWVRVKVSFAISRSALLYLCLTVHFVRLLWYIIYYNTRPYIETVLHIRMPYL